MSRPGVRILAISLTTLATFVVACMTSLAGCPHCYDIVKVRAEFRDGTTREAYFEHHPEVMPAKEDADGATVIDLSGDPSGTWPTDTIRLIDEIYYFEDITTATTPKQIDTVASADIERLVYLEKIRYGGAGSMNVYEPDIIDLFEQEPVARHDFDGANLAESIYLSYHPEVAESSLQQLANHYYKPAFLDRDLESWGQTLDYFESDSPDWLPKVGLVLNERINSVTSHLKTYESLAGPNPVGQYFEAIAENLRQRSRFLAAVQTYFDDRDLGDFKDELEDLFSSTSGEDRFEDIEFADDAAANLPQMKTLFAVFYDTFRLTNVLGEDYNDSLEEAEIILVVNPYD